MPDSNIGREDLGLTKRQHQVARLAAQGHTNDEIADHLHIAARTVKGHMEVILRKLNLSRKRELVKAYPHDNKHHNSHKKEGTQ